MARAMLETTRLPEELEALIVQKAEGNPFFVEEVVKFLQETGTSWPGRSTRSTSPTRSRM